MEVLIAFWTPAKHLSRGSSHQGNRNALQNRHCQRTDPIQQKAAADANLVQSACNLVAIVGAFHGHLLALHRAGVFGDDLINHPIALAFVSKLNSLCRIDNRA